MAIRQDKFIMLKKTFISKTKHQKLIKQLETIKSILQKQNYKNQHQRNLQKIEVIDYAQLLFILLKKKTTLIAINHFLINKYNGHQQGYCYQDIKLNWKQYLSNQKIVQDAINLIEIKIEQPWKPISQQEVVINAKKQQIKQYEKINVKNKKQIKDRIKQLKDQMIQVQANMNMAKKQQDVVQHNKKYQQIYKQYKYWKQRNRNIRDLSINQRIKQSQSKNKVIQQKINKMLTIVTQIEAQQQKSKRLKTLQPCSNPIQMPKQIKSLEKIFNYYARLNLHRSLFFQDAKISLQKIQLQAFMKFLKDFQLNKVLSSAQLLQIFKKRTKSLRHINLQQFIAIFQDIYVEECNKNNVPFKSLQFDKYVQNIVLAKDKIQKIFRLRIKTEDTKSISPNPLLHSKLSKYVFQPTSHSGKFKEVINQQLHKNKKSFQFVPCMKSNFNIKGKLTLNKSETNIQQKGVLLNTSKNSSRISDQSKCTKLSKLFNKKSSYVHKFKQRLLQNQKNRRVSEDQNYKINKTLEQIDKSFNYQQQNIQQAYQNQNLKGIYKSKQLQELQMLIGIEKNDEFLQRHLLPSINKVQFHHKKRFMF